MYDMQKRKVGYWRTIYSKERKVTDTRYTEKKGRIQINDKQKKMAGYWFKMCGKERQVTDVWYTEKKAGYWYDMQKR